MIRKITINDAGYPKNLKNIYDPPKALYVNGSFSAQDAMAVAIVGSRRATLYGLQMSEKFGYELASRGITVVSGMARGIDSAAHRGALKAKGRTIAVMGSGHGHIYPPENAKLYEEIAAAGAVVTEFEDAEEPLAYHFPMRNRIISGLSLGVLVVEAAKDSGALITADLAAEQGREVFALPGKISSATSSGANRLIKDGALLVETVDDILEELKIIEMKPLSGAAKDKKDGEIARKTKAYVCNSLTEDERAVYGTLSDEPLYIDDIVNKANVGLRKAADVLLKLQLKHLVTEMPGKQFVRKAG